MKKIDKIIMTIRQNRGVLADKYGVDVVGIFGSYARGEQRRGSDIDLLAEIVKPVSLLELVGAELYLGEKLKAKVELVLKRNVREELREAIMTETVAV